MPVASPLGDYLRAVQISDIDPLFDDIHVDENGSISEDADGEMSAAEQLASEPEKVSDVAEDDASDWLSDETDETPLPAPQATPPRAPEPSTPSSASDWLFDEEPGEDDVTEPAPQQLESPADAEDEEDDEEDFEGFTAAPPAARTARYHRAEPTPTPSTPTPAPAEQAAPAPRGRRRVSMPTFADPAPTQQDAPGVAVEAIDRDFDDVLIPDAEETDDEDLDVDQALDGAFSSSSRSAAHRSAPLGIVMAIVAGKGGVGKSTVSLCIAQAAAEVGGLSVCLIDANRGQGDLGLYLRVRKSDLPSIYDAVTIGDLSTAILSPEQIASARNGSGDRISFSFVQAPRPLPGGEVSHEIRAVRPEHYAEVIDRARGQFDLVIVDTQITEGLDTSGVIDDVVGPLLHRGGYGLGIAEFSTTGVENLLIAMNYLRNLGADSARMMSIVNRLDSSVHEYGKLPQLLGRESKWKGAVQYNERIYDDMVSRHVPYNVPTMRRVVMDVLFTVTGIDEFTTRGETEPKTSKLPWWKRWFRR
ncbi:AAA family ATPase [Brachybacterium kimchii]|uniref:CobQ/CobB/MinD/ParA nucleotide binding domain-containing protein n=1 Tax=Brachybacterium kimchii TaxID=2942909 RepID=A0ABY4NAL2_9MICO|nr:hypothetical protein [Brachybacterium kimchii]UQN30458.1 hypothetical protein M4486_03710 [Brachybacterium kimchii]